MLAFGRGENNTLEIGGVGSNHNICTELHERVLFLVALRDGGFQDSFTPVL